MRRDVQKSPRNLPQLQESEVMRLGKADPYKPVDIFVDEYLTDHKVYSISMYALSIRLMVTVWG